ncbi:MAG: alanine--glyoxylate aminotransferase family protein [Candidatus Omnitrophota bacterium]
MKKYVLLNPGPVNIKENVRRALLGPDICHREPEFEGLLSDCRKKILKAFEISDSYEVVFFTGSGTAALEAAIISSIPRNKKILVINNGIYGERIAEIALRHGIKVVNLKFDVTGRPDLRAIEDKLVRGKGISAAAMVHHETSTGLLNPVYEIGKLCARHKKLYLLDSISALGGEDIDFKKAAADLCVGTVNKCVEAIPGVSFVFLKKSALNGLRKIKPRSLYLDLMSNLDSQKNREPLFTPAVQTFYAIDAALDELIKEGVENRIKRYRHVAALLREGFESMGLSCLISRQLRSNTITALYLPAGLSYKKLHDSLKKSGFVIYAGQSKLKDVIFRIANMGQITKAAAERFLKSLKVIIKNKPR